MDLKCIKNAQIRVYISKKWWKIQIFTFFKIVKNEKFWCCFLWKSEVCEGPKPLQPRKQLRFAVKWMDGCQHQTKIQAFSYPDSSKPPIMGRDGEIIQYNHKMLGFFTFAFCKISVSVYLHKVKFADVLPLGTQTQALSAAKPTLAYSEVGQDANSELHLLFISHQDCKFSNQ